MLKSGAQKLSPAFSIFKDWCRDIFLQQIHSKDFHLLLPGLFKLDGSRIEFLPLPLIT